MSRFDNLKLWVIIMFLCSNFISRLAYKSKNWFLFFLLIQLASQTQAAIDFNTSDPGVFKGMSFWGIGWIGNTQSSINRMGGAQNIDAVRIGCPNEWRLDDNNDLVPEAIAEVDKQIAAASRVITLNPDAGVALVCSGGKNINSWYVQSNGTDIRGARWLDMFRAVKNYIENNYGYRILYLEIGNEQDFNNKIGSAENLNSVQQRFRDDPEFAGIPLAGAFYPRHWRGRKMVSAYERYLGLGAVLILLMVLVKTI